MSYNDGQAHLEIFDETKNMEEIALEFSEGDETLYNTLMDLWNNGIKTMACCSGHNGTKTFYLTLLMDENSKSLIDAAGDYLYIQDGDMEITFMRSTDNHDSMTVYINGDEEKNEYLNFIRGFLKKNKDEEINATNNIQSYAKYLLDFAKKVDLNCRYDINKELMIFGYYPKGSIQLFDENVPKLDDILDEIRSTNRFPAIPLLCNEESLKEFIGILYPNLVLQNNNIQK